MSAALLSSAHAAEPCTSVAACEKMKLCAAKPFYKWLTAHKAGDINTRTNLAFKSDSNGSCRMDQAAIKTAIESGKITK